MDLLRDIVAHKRKEVARRRRERPLGVFKKRPSRPPRNFAAALRQPGIAAIAEIKRRSPSRGPLCEALDAAAVAGGYARSGAAALSVLTDREFFGGSEDDLRLVSENTALPVLRKDFTIDEFQIHEARQLGADAILLIVRILSDGEIRRYLRTTRELGLTALVEAHDETELSRAIDCGADIIGVNNRNLDTFEVDLGVALRLKDDIPEECVAVAESGIRTRDDVRRLEAAGYDALLVGEALLCAPDPGAKLAELLGVKGWLD